MKITYNEKGDTQKLLVKVLGEILGVKSEYMGAPIFAYQLYLFGNQYLETQ